jgi:hypothetical protein
MRTGVRFSVTAADLDWLRGRIDDRDAVQKHAPHAAHKHAEVQKWSARRVADLDKIIAAVSRQHHVLDHSG